MLNALDGQLPHLHFVAVSCFICSASCVLSPVTAGHRRRCSFRLDAVVDPTLRVGLRWSRSVGVATFPSHPLEGYHMRYVAHRCVADGQTRDSNFYGAPAATHPTRCRCQGAWLASFLRPARAEWLGRLFKSTNALALNSKLRNGTADIRGG